MSSSSKDVSVAPDRTPFWQFSGGVYARRGVAEACLALQERHRLDVNLLLFCAWAGCNGRRLDGGDLGLLRSVARPWHDQVVAPLVNAAHEALDRARRAQLTELFEHGLEPAGADVGDRVGRDLRSSARPTGPFRSAGATAPGGGRRSGSWR